MRYAAAVVFLCKTSQQFTTVTHCETTDKDTGLNYSGELIGAVIATSLLRILSEYTSTDQNTQCSIYCDNLGVVEHGTDYMKSLPKRQVWLDLICLLCRNVHTLPVQNCLLPCQRTYGQLCLIQCIKPSSAAKCPSTLSSKGSSTPGDYTIQPVWTNISK